MSLRFFGATDKNLAKSDIGVGAGKISIQRQRMFTFGDALWGAPLVVKMSTNPNDAWPRAWSGTEDKALVNFASAATKAAAGSVTKKSAPAFASVIADPTSASTCRDRR